MKYIQINDEGYTPDGKWRLVPVEATDADIHVAYRSALRQSIRERDMPEIRRFAHAAIKTAPLPPAEMMLSGEPVAMVDAGDDGYFVEILPDRSVSAGDHLYAFPPLSAARELWVESFKQWWDAHGQYLRAGGGQYEKTFGYHAWEAAAALYAEPVPTPAAPAEPDLIITKIVNVDLWVQVGKVYARCANTREGTGCFAFGDRRFGVTVDTWALMINLDQSAPQAPAVPATCNDSLQVDIREMLQWLIDQRGKHGHNHKQSGIWDDDNGAMAGKPCEDCAMYDKARALLQSAPQAPAVPEEWRNDVFAAADELRKTVRDLKNGFVRCSNCGEQDTTSDLDCVSDIDGAIELLDALLQSAKVTDNAAADRLMEGE